MFVWERNGALHQYEIVVQRDLARLNEQIKRLFPNEAIDAQSNGKSIVLSGYVSSKEMSAKAASAVDHKVITWRDYQVIRQRLASRGACLPACICMRVARRQSKERDSSPARRTPRSALLFACSAMCERGVCAFPADRK